jgi:rhodanese-related sulfurtransferase
VKSVCVTLATWKSDVTGAASKLQTASSAAKSLVQGKAEYVVFVTSLVAATQKAASGLKSAGIPNVKDGKQGATTLSQAFDQASTSLAGTIAKAKAIPTTSAAAYQAAASGVSNQFKSSLNALANASPKKNDALKAAAAKDPTCKALNAG